jgi:hypothetical protein
MRLRQVVLSIFPGKTLFTIFVFYLRPEKQMLLILEGMEN